jgi:hypothetical protein
LGCGLQFGDAENDLLAIGLQNVNTLFSAARTSNSRCLVLWSKDVMRVSFYLNEAVRNSALYCAKSSGNALR